MLSVLFLAGSCTDITPTSDDAGLIPIDPRTIEIRLPFHAFADSLQLLEGYSSPALLPGALVARKWRGDLDANTLVRFGHPNDRIFVIPPGSTTQVTVADAAYRPIRGRVIVFFDSIEVSGTPTFEFKAGAVQTPWHVRSTSWDSAIDTLGNQSPWPEPGAGPVTPLGVARWDGLAESDSIFFPVDSLTISRWFDQTRPENGVRISVTQDGARVRIREAALVYSVRSSINPDTVVEISALSREMTEIYSPRAVPLDGGFRIGGAPAHRAVIHFRLPESVEGDASVCGSVPCTVEFRPDRVVYAGLLLYTQRSAPLGLQPLDTIGIDMRPVLSPDRVRRSPLGRTVQDRPTFIDPDLFGDGSDTLVEFPMTRYVRDLMREIAPGDDPVSPALALVTGFEPWFLERATFWGPGSGKYEPVLRIVLTITDGLALP